MYNINNGIIRESWFDNNNNYYLKSIFEMQTTRTKDLTDDCSFKFISWFNSCNPLISSTRYSDTFS